MTGGLRGHLNSLTLVQSGRVEFQGVWNGYCSPRSELSGAVSGVRSRDVVGNEAGYFVRDDTNGGTLAAENRCPAAILRIHPSLTPSPGPAYL